MNDQQPPTFYDVFEPYFRENEERANFRDFVNKHCNFIATNHRIGEDLQRTWLRRYTNAQQYYCGGSEVAVSVQRNEKPNWGTVATKILELQLSSSSVSEDATTSVETASTTTAASLTDSFWDEFKATYSSMKDTEKWELPSGLKVEDVMYKFGLTCGTEHAAHSFIIDLSDPIWKTLFQHKQDREEIYSIKAKNMPAVDVRFKQYLESYIDKTTFSDLLAHARSQYFDPIKDYDMHWAQHTMETALLLYPFPGKYFPLSDQTESDILKHLWIFVDKAFDDTPITIRSGEMENVASSTHNNSECLLGERKLHGHRVDMLLKVASDEFGCAEAGRRDGGEFATKERNEKWLKAPKALKDMLCSLRKAWPNARDLETLAFIIMGTKLTLIRMDRPSSYVCRVKECKSMHFPTSLDTFAVDMGSLLSLVNQAKTVVKRTVTATKRESVEEGADDDSFVTTIPDLPPCPSSPRKPNKRQRTRL
ncbi:hypothetical protein BJV82DRAFT_662627 [Fennellomyces sp. T-0311]|nr:hypothetical protein BJV82DRAFT_662627 [Fennellomyces sp. T-0311]